MNILACIYYHIYIYMCYICIRLIIYIYFRVPFQTDSQYVPTSTPVAAMASMPALEETILPE